MWVAPIIYCYYAAVRVLHKSRSQRVCLRARLYEAYSLRREMLKRGTRCAQTSAFLYAFRGYSLNGFSERRPETHPLTAP